MNKERSELEPWIDYLFFEISMALSISGGMMFNGTMIYIIYFLSDVSGVNTDRLRNDTEVTSSRSDL